MDRRTLLAFLLATVVLVVYQLIAPPPPRTAPRTEEAEPAGVGTDTPESAHPESGAQPADSWTATSSGTTDLDAGANARGAAEWGVPPDSAAALTPGPLTLAHERFAVRIGQRGGVPSQWELSEWTDARGDPVRLVADGKPPLFELAVVHSGGRVELSNVQFRVREASARGARLVAVGPNGSRVELDYQVGEAYQVDLEVTVAGFDTHDGEGSLEITFPRGIPPQEKLEKQDEQAAAALAMLGNRLVKHGHHGKKPGWQQTEEGVVRWFGMRTKYFLAAVTPTESPDATVVMTRGRGQTDIRSTLALPLALSGPSRFSLQLYGGPLEYGRLEQMSAGQEKAVDLGWSIFLPLTRALLKFFQWMHGLVPNYGVVIVILSVLVKLAFYPLTKASLDSMRQMQALKPEMDKVAEKYKNDPEQRNRATLELYKKFKVNPLSGCLPILIQIPVFGALYNVFNTAIELRKAPFGAWIQDLSAPDTVGAIVGFPINILPLLLAVTAIIQQKLTPTDPRQAAMFYLLPIITTVFFYTLPSGLVLYWTVTNLLQIGQQILVNRSAAPLAKAA